MAFAIGSRHSVGYVAETVFGTTPGTPTMKRFRSTTPSLALNKDTFASGELREDRQVVDLRHGIRRGAGDIPFELVPAGHDDIIEMACFGTWASNVLKMGTTAKSATFERRFGDIGQYLQFPGGMVNTLAFSIPANGIVTCTAGIISKDVIRSATPLAANLTDVSTKPAFDTFSGTLNEGGSAIALVTGLEFTLNNNLEPTFVVGSATSPEITAGRAVVTGTLSAHFSTAALLDKFINETESSLELTLDDPAGAQNLTISMPRIKYTGAGIPTVERGIVLSMPFQALRDPTAATNIVFTRVP
jgi:hypothetical protein